MARLYYVKIGLVTVMTKPEKERLDQWLVDNGHFESRAKAQAAILEGLILVNGKPPRGAAVPVTEKTNVEVIKPLHQYVGRGGIKLEKAIDDLKIIVAPKICIDVGASTGGFTDCLLQNGAIKVYAVDVGYGQLDWKLRKDSRVVVIERTNIRYLQPQKLYEGSHPSAQLAVIDVSFISLSKVFPAVKELLVKNGEIVALIKPQFEAGRGEVQKGGLIKDPDVHERVIIQVAREASKIGLTPVGLTYSPISGADGNLEFFISLCNGMPKQKVQSIEDIAPKVVAAAHRAVTEKDTEEERPPQAESE